MATHKTAKPRRRTKKTPEPKPPPEQHTLAVDIGGEGTKMLLLDAAGAPITPRARQLTPTPATPSAVLSLIQRMAKELPPFARVSVGFPGVVTRGIVQTAPNLGTELWRGRALADDLSESLGCPVRVCNDADLQGFGVIGGQGVELVLTLGTGLGTALFTDGHLVPNFELGHHPYRKQRTYEERLSNTELKSIGKQRWSRRLLRVIEQLEPIYNYEVLHLGGGNARKIQHELPKNVRVFTNVEGMRGGIRLWGAGL